MTDKKKTRQPEYGQFNILVTDHESFWIADRFFYTFNHKSAEQKRDALRNALYDAGIQQIKDPDNLYVVVER